MIAPKENNATVSTLANSNVNSVQRSAQQNDSNNQGQNRNQTTVAALPAEERMKIYTWISSLGQTIFSSTVRETALLELSKKREVVQDLAPLIWHSFGGVAALLQEIISIYPYINPPCLTAHQSNRVCNTLALMQCIASHSETRSLFLYAHVPHYLFPFLRTVSKERPFEYLRLTSLGVIGALVKTDEQDVINFLLSTEIIPLCLRIMETGSELSKTVATFILQKILLDNTGLFYICQTYDRFSHVAMILGKMVIALAKEPSARLLKHVVRCYLRLSDNPRACEALGQCLPDQLRDGVTFQACLKDDKSTSHWLTMLLKNLDNINSSNGSSAAASAATATNPSSTSIVTGNGGANNGLGAASVLSSSTTDANGNVSLHQQGISGGPKEEKSSLPGGL